MPAIITHHLFGEEAARRLPADFALAQEELLAFLLGNQGPDPFYFCFTDTPGRVRICHEFADAMHRAHVVDALMCVHDTVRYLPVDDQGVGRAFSLGLVAHYLLDSEAHAFILSQEGALCGAGVGLDDAHDEVHALIESELDTWMLWSARNQTIADSPAWANLTRTERVGRVAGTLFAQLAWEVFGLKLGADCLEGCLRDYELLYRAIDPTGNPYGTLLSKTERLRSRHSILSALSHGATPTDGCPAANLDCRPWVDPLTGQVQTTSFPDVFYDALELWPALAESFVYGDRTALEAQMRRSYDGSARQPADEECR